MKNKFEMLVVIEPEFQRLPIGSYNFPVVCTKEEIHRNKVCPMVKQAKVDNTSIVSVVDSSYTAHFLYQKNISGWFNIQAKDVLNTYKNICEKCKHNINNIDNQRS